MEFNSSQHFELMAKALAAVIDGVIIVDVDGQQVFMNEVSTRLLGPLLSPEKPFVKQTVEHQLRYPDGRRILPGETPLERALLGETIVDFQLVLGKADGDDAYLWVYANPVEDERGRIIGAIATFRDVTKQRQVEEALRLSEEHFRQLAEGASDMIYRYRLSPTRAFEYVNPAASAITGYSKEEHYANPELLFQIVHPEDRQVVRCLAHSPTVIGGAGTLRFVCKDGQVIWTEHRVAPIKDAQGHVIAIEGIARDITAGKRAEEALRASEANYRAIFDTANDGIFVHDKDTGEIVDANQKACEMYGYTAEEVRLLNVKEFSAGRSPYSHEDSQSRIMKAVAGKPQLFEWLAKAKSGRLFWVEVNLKRATIGGQDRLLAIVRDISERKRMEEALRQSEDRFRSVIEQTYDGISLVDEQGTIIEWNESLERISGFKRSEVIGRPVWDVYFEALPKEAQTPEARGRARAAMEEGLRTGQVTWSQRPHEARIQRPDGERRVIQILAFPIRIDQSFLGCAVFRDITESKQMEEQLQRTRRLEMIEQVIGHVAHDFNNLLGALMGYPDLIKRELPPGNPAVKFCDTMMRAANQMADINADLLTLCRRAHFNQEPTDLNLLVRETLEQQLPLQHDHLRVELDLTEGIPPVKGSVVQLGRVLANLIANAREAMQDSGLLRIQTEPTYLDKAAAQLKRIEEGDYVKLVVSDDGGGMTEEIRERIFDPFFTTKHDSHRRGSGLGLSVVQAIVEDHQGCVAVQSEVGRGTTFSVYLPAGQKAALIHPPTVASTESQSIVVVDDEESLREVIRLILKEMGYSVQSVESGEEAIAYLKEHPADLLVLDMVMPGGIDGAETYRQAMEIHSGLKAILISGHAESERVREALRLGASKCLTKPFGMEQLEREVRRELERKD